MNTHQAENAGWKNWAEFLTRIKCWCYTRFFFFFDVTPDFDESCNTIICLSIWINKTWKTVLSNYGHFSQITSLDRYSASFIFSSKFLNCLPALISFLIQGIFFKSHTSLSLMSNHSTAIWTTLYSLFCIYLQFMCLSNINDYKETDP